MRGLQEKRPLLVTLAVLACIVLLTVAVGVVLTAIRGRRFSSDSSAMYPYAWTEKPNGTITLDLDGSKIPDGVWETDSSDSFLAVELGETVKGKVRAALSPVGEGRSMLTFTLTDGENRLAEASFLVDVEEENGKFTATIADHRETAWQARVSGGTETEYPFTVEVSPLGGVVIHITDAEIALEQDLVFDDETEPTSEEAEPLSDEAESSDEEVESSDEEVEPSSEHAAEAMTEPDLTEAPGGMETEEPVPEVPEEGEPGTDEPEEGTDENPIPWEAYSSNELIVFVDSVIHAMQGVDVYLEGRVSGTATVTVSRQTADLSYVFTFQRSGNSLLLTDSRVQSYTPYVPPVLPEFDMSSLAMPESSDNAAEDTVSSETVWTRSESEGEETE